MMMITITIRISSGDENRPEDSMYDYAVVYYTCYFNNNCTYVTYFIRMKLTNIKYIVSDCIVEFLTT